MFQRILKKLREEWFYLRKYPTPRYGKEFNIDYENYWRERRSGTAAILSVWQKERADEALKIIEPGATVIDLGCGDGAVLKYFEQTKGIKGIGVDISDIVLQQARQLGIKTLTIDLTKSENLLQLPEADYITGFEILEHMPNPETFLCYASQKARQGLIFSVPNTGYYIHRLRLLFGKFPLQWVTHPGEHLRFWTARDMLFWLNSLSFKLNRLILYQGIPGLNKIWPRLFAKGIIIFISAR